ncbi:hypothetical protein [Nocardia sp. CNY236]|uniref:hypothetical protein n=1 Tax=Nocardia sp. CNY236 TaxID=1169152 RepID=UPI000427D80F|nr:hypothetical protein [Nocardia sp. CNY236]
MATVLKVLLAERHLTRHADFLSMYDRCAQQLDPPMPPGHGPAKAQYYQWLSGRMIGLPRDYHRRVLERMFPGWTVDALFQVAEATSTGVRPPARDPSDSEVRLEAFLGAEMATSGATLIYPRRELAATSVVAEDDFRGLLYVFALLQRHTAIPTTVQNDRAVAAHRDRSYISFGLSGRHCTHVYLRTVEPPLFTVRLEATENRRCAAHLQLIDGSRYDSSDERPLGIIARVRPNPQRHPGRYWIYCAGLGPRGTAGAGWYLANHWTPLQQRTGDREFIAVVRINGHSDRTAGLEHLVITSATRQ